MPARAQPTARQVRLGAELRKLREGADKTAREAASLLGTDQGKMSNIESGRIGVSEERIQRLAAFYACDDTALINALCAIAREHRGQFWWDEFRGILPPSFLDMAELEHHATCLRSAHTVVVPGLLQTEDYARALFRARVPKLSTKEIEDRVEHRMRRQSIFERESPPPLEVIVHEAALRMRFGGRKVLRKQLELLVEASSRPTVTLRVLPFTNEDFIEATHSTLYAQGVVPQLDTIQMDTLLGGALLDAESDVKKYRVVLQMAVQRSLDPEESRQLIRHIGREL